MNYFHMLPERAFRSLGGRLLTLEGGGKGGSKAPDYEGAAQVQAQSSKEVTNLQNWANRPTLNTPWGKMEWGASPTIDPATGQPVTSWTGNLTMTPEEQASLESQQAVTKGRSQGAETLLGQAVGGFKDPADWSKLPGMGTLEGVGYRSDFSAPGYKAGTIGRTDFDPATARNRAEQALFQRQIGMIEPGLTQSEAARRTRMANMGISPEGGSEAWNRAQTGMDATRNKAYSDAALAAIAGGGAEATRELGLAQGAQGLDIGREQANLGLASGEQGIESGRLGMATAATDAMNKQRQQAIAEMAQQRGMSLNELNALLTGQQVSMPQMPGFTNASRAEPVRALDAANMEGNFNLANQDKGMDWGTLLGTGASMAMRLSDRRLKKNILPLGGGWYAFNYLWDKVLRIGVMAQDLLKTKPEAVILMPNGYYAVDYSKL